MTSIENYLRLELSPPVITSYPLKKRKTTNYIFTNCFSIFYILSKGKSYFYVKAKFTRFVNNLAIYMRDAKGRYNSASRQGYMSDRNIRFTCCGKQG